MVDKLHHYEGFLGRLHTFREGIRAQWSAWREELGDREGFGDGFPLGFFGWKTHTKESQRGRPLEREATEYSHIYR
jgi:hypothetical protein